MKTCLILLALVISPVVWASDEARNPNWAIPLKIEGVPNLHKISDCLYRSAQPTEGGMKNLEALGVKKTINLRAFHSDKDHIEQTSLLDEELSVKSWHIEAQDVIKVLKIISKAEQGPFLIHCQHGADRTGLMCAMYRIVVQGWSKQDAIDEMRYGGYGYHAIWSNIPKWIDKCDIEMIKRRLQE